MTSTARIRSAFVVVLLLCAGLLSSPASAAEDNPFNQTQKTALDRLIRNYIMQHPEVIMDSMQAMQEREQLVQERLQTERVTSLNEAIEHNPSDPVMGNPDGDVTLVEFFDYQCGYCKRMIDPLLDFARSDGNLRIVLKEFPILGPESMIAARASLAAHKQGKYEAFHVALMRLRGRLSEPAIFQTAVEVGLDTEQLQKDMNAPAVMEQIRKSRELGQALAIRGTPAFVIGGKIIPGAMGEGQLRDLVTQQRGKG
jgi:protein-disulfide isomerase